MKRPIAILFGILLLKPILESLWRVYEWTASNPNTIEIWRWFDVGKYSIIFILSLYIATLPIRKPIYHYLSITLTIDSAVDLGFLLLNNDDSNRKPVALQLSLYLALAVYFWIGYRLWLRDMSNSITIPVRGIKYRVVRVPKTLLGRLYRIQFPVRNAVYYKDGFRLKNNTWARGKKKSDEILDPVRD